MLRKLGQKSIKIGLFAVAAISAFLAVALVVVADDRGADELLRYYVDRADHAFESTSPATQGTRLSFRTTSYYKQVTRGGVVTKTDTAVIDFFYSWGNLDSQVVVSGGGGRFDRLDLSFPNVFSSDYRFNLFPNDTGGPELAIGFDTDSVSDTRPVGLALIDREYYYPLWMYLFYPHRGDFTRFTRSFRFTRVDGVVLADSIWEVGARQGVFFSEHYRLETGISDVKIDR